MSSSCWVVISTFVSETCSRVLLLSEGLIMSVGAVGAAADRLCNFLSPDPDECSNIHYFVYRKIALL